MTTLNTNNPMPKEHKVVINLTQHIGTPEQQVMEPANKDAVKALLTFSTLPAEGEIYARAKALAEIALESGATAAMIGGAPYLMGPLERELHARGITPLYSFTERTVEETVMPDGTTVKKSIFKHVGFVKALWSLF